MIVTTSLNPSINVAKVLTGSTIVPVTDVGIDEENFAMPASLEDTLEDIFIQVQDRASCTLKSHGCGLMLNVSYQDTVVRWSAAKGLARISERLPSSFADQVPLNVLALFEIHWFEDKAGHVELPASAEGTWHGACLAIAEFARRGLVCSQERLGDVIKWVSRVQWCLKSLSYYPT
jgi:hypothetical protein